MKLTIVRHGETDWNKVRKIQGQIDIGLNLFGVQQAHTCAKYLANEHFDSVYSSPLSRAYETAKIITAKRDCHISVKDDLQEINMGKWQGMIWSEIVKTHSDLYVEFEKVGDFSKVYKGESFKELQDRAARFLDYLVETPYESVLAVSHGGLIKVLICYVLGLDLSKRTKFNIDNLSISRLHYSQERGWTVLSLNEYTYLDDLFSSGGNI